ncbi:MAG: HIT family protein [Chloroflexota bacterium]
MATDCLFCTTLLPSARLADVTVYEDDLVYASHVVDEDGLTYLGQLILQTKRHVPGYAELTDGEAIAIGLAIVRISRALKACTDAEKIYVVTFAEVVPHLHTYLTSRYPGTPPQYWRMNIENWPDAPQGDRGAVVSLCECLRSTIESAARTHTLDSVRPE